MKLLRPILISAAALLLLAAWFLLVRIPSDEVGIADSGRPGDTPAVMGPGFHFRPPGVRIVTYPLTPVSADGQTLVTPASGGEIPAHYSVTGRLDPARAAELYGPIGGRPLPDFLSMQAGILLREYASRAEAVEVLTPQFRAKAAEEVAAVMQRGGLAGVSMKIRPPDEETLLAAAQFLAPKGEAWRIRQAVAEALSEPDASKSWRLQTALGLVNESERLLADCEKNYLDALAIDPLAIPPMTQLVALYSAVNEWPKLRRVVDAALTADPKSLPHINWAAMVLIKQNELEMAEKLLGSGLAIDPSNSVLLMNLAGLYLKTGRIDDAVARLRQSAEADPTNMSVLFNLGSALAAQGRFDDALGYLERAEASGVMTPPLARALQFVHEKLGHSPQAATYRERVRQLEAEAASRRKPSQGGSHEGSSATKSPS